jgi:hypothetical protein
MAISPLHELAGGEAVQCLCGDVGSALAVAIPIAPLPSVLIGIYLWKSALVPALSIQHTYGRMTERKLLSYKFRPRFQAAIFLLAA